MRTRWLLCCALAVSLTAAACTGESADTTTAAPTTTSTTTTTIGVEIRTRVEPTFTVGQGVDDGVAGELQGLIDELRLDVEGLRGLVFLDPPQISFVSDEGFAARHGAWVEARLDPDTLGTETRLMRVLALMDPADDLRATLVDLYDDPVRAFYDGDTGEVVVSAGSGDLSPQDHTDVVRSLVAALTDQYHRHTERSRDLAAEGRTDEATALEALAVADANYFQLLYAQGLPEEDQVAIAAASPEAPSLPGYLREQLRVSGEFGFELVIALLDTGGIGGLDAAYSAPLLTTEHILVPARFAAGERLMDIDHHMPEASGYDVATAGTWGAGTLRGLLAASLSPGMLTQTADGWGADWSVILEDGDDLAWVYTFRGDSVEDALEVTQGFISHIETVMGMGGGVASGGGVEYVGSPRSGDDFAYIDREGDGLVVVVATDPEVGRSLSRSVPVP